MKALNARPRVFNLVLQVTWEHLKSFTQTRNIGSYVSGKDCLGSSVKDGLPGNPGLMEKLVA